MKTKLIVALTAIGMLASAMSILAEDMPPPPPENQPPQQEIKPQDMPGNRGGEMRGRNVMRERGGRMEGMNKLMPERQLEAKYPEEMKEIKKLRDTANEKMQALVKKEQAEIKARQEKQEKFRNAIQEYKKNPTPELLEQIKAGVTDHYTMQLENMKKRIGTEETRIKEAKAKCEELAANKDQEIAKRIENITKK
ncbi:MAG: hypothetical protein WC071_13930 [Victivallaceae bacterium]